MLIESPNIIKDPVISIIVTTYNQRDYLRQCLDSILAQEVNVPYELIIGEDCSKDGTQDICREYQARYPDKVRLALAEVNQGLIRNYRHELSMCRGKYIAQLAGDDFWCDKNKLQKQYEALEAHPECDLCYTNCYTCDDYGRINKTPLVKSEPVTFESHLLDAGYISPCSWVFRREVLEYMDLQDWFTDESLAIALDVLHHSKLYFIDEPTNVYRVHDNSAANQTDPKKMWKYQYGVMQIQLYYAQKYKMPESFVTHMKIQEYYSKCFWALEAEDIQFVEEAMAFCKSNGIIMRGFLNSCREYIEYKRQYEQIRSSKAYRIGKAILKPFKKLRSGKRKE